MYAWKSWKEVLELGRFIDFQNDEGTFSIDTSTIPFFRYHHCLRALPLRTQMRQVFLIDASCMLARHGSENSLDEDTLYLFPSLPDAKACERFIAGSADDRNIFTVTEASSADGARSTVVVKECDQGYPDEINNALLGMPQCML
jgi:hypothetical protein